MPSILRSAIVAMWPGAPKFLGRRPRLVEALRRLGLVRPEPYRSLKYSRPTTGVLTELIHSYAERGVSQFVLGRLIARQDRAAAVELVQFLHRASDAFAAVTLDQVEAHVARFRQVFLSAPITGNTEGANFPTGLAIYVIVSCLRPNLIVESGIWKGLSSFYLSAAAPPAKILAFDVSLELLAHRAANVTYHECDWMAVDVGVPLGTGALAYFDDHQNQARRVIEAHQRGFKFLLFDDCWPTHAVNGAGGQPLPSIDMVLADDLQTGETIEWIEAGRLCTYLHDPEMQELAMRARGLIKAAHDVPTLYRATGYAPTSSLKFVELR